MNNITNVKLLNVPLEADYKHTLYFESAEAQEKYFKSKSALSFDDFSYQRKDHKIRIPRQFDEINGKVNYVMYQNKVYNNKWFYAFITNIQYVSDGVTDVFIKTDVMQTWAFNYQLKSCFVEREHTKDDTIGKNTVPEGLETGEYICNKVIENRSTDSISFIVASAVDLSNGADSNVRIYNGVLNGWYYYRFKTVAEVREALKDISTLRTNDAIVSIFIMPDNFVHSIDGSNQVMESWEIPKFAYWDLDGESKGQDCIKKPNSVNGYIPQNNKLLTYPYSYILMDNNSGGVATYKYELFDGETSCDFVIYGCITPGGSLRLMPLRYNGVRGENHHFGLNGGKFPVCGWQSDYYTNWLTQNALNIEVQTERINLTGLQSAINNSLDGGRTGAGLATSMISGDAKGAVSGLLDVAQNISNSYFIAKQQLNEIKGITAQKEMHSFQSPTVGGSVSSGDINYCMGNIKFTAYQMSVKEEYAKIIDNYFSMYGYQTNRVKVPNKAHRYRYWYTKTVGCEIDGAIPNEDIQLIKSCYDSGVTFWRNANEIGKYTDPQDDELYYNGIV